MVAMCCLASPVSILLSYNSKVNFLWGTTPPELHVVLVGLSVYWQHGQCLDLNSGNKI